MNKPHAFNGGKVGILLVNLGTPDEATPSAVRRYLREFLSDPRVVEIPRWLWLPLLNGIILPFRAGRTAKNYQKIWTEEGSPLRVFTHNLTCELQKELANDDYVIQYAMRYGKPSIEEQLNNFQQQHISKLIVLPLYPQYSATTSGTVFDEVARVISQWRWVPDIKFINHYSDHELYIQALSDSIRSHWEKNGRAEKLIFSFHGLPKRFLELGDPYFCYCQKTARLVKEKLNLTDNDTRIVFQSRFGKAEWLQPYCVDTLQQLPLDGCKSVDIICPGFAVDCLETLEEIAMTNKNIFIQAGGEMYNYIPALNAAPSHVQMLSRLIK